MSGYLVNIFYITGLNNTNTTRSIVYLVHAEQRLVLWYEGVSGRGEDLDEHVLGEAVEGHDDGQPAHELGDHAELDEVARLHLAQQRVALLVVLGGGHALRLVLEVGHGRSPPALARRGRRAETQVLGTNIFNLTTHSTHFIYSYMASHIW